MHIAEQEQRQINELVKEVERKSGAQVLIAIVARADAYPEIPWKAFAIGSALAGLFVMAETWSRHQWMGGLAGFEAAVILGAAAAAALLSIFVPPFARLFVSRLRAEAEVRQYAQSVFLDRGVFQTQERVGLLLFISLFEREAVILPDVAIRRHLNDGQLERVAAAMRPELSRNEVAAACATGLNALAQMLHGRLPVPRVPANELPDALVQERGA